MKNFLKSKIKYVLYAVIVVMMFLVPAKLYETIELFSEDWARTMTGIKTDIKVYTPDRARKGAVFSIVFSAWSKKHFHDDQTVYVQILQERSENGVVKYDKVWNKTLIITPNQVQASRATYEKEMPLTGSPQILLAKIEVKDRNNKLILLDYKPIMLVVLKNSDADERKNDNNKYI